jgi:hypothetical protein
MTCRQPRNSDSSRPRKTSPYFPCMTEENREFRKWLAEWIASVPKGEGLLASTKNQKKEDEPHVQKSADTVDGTVTKAA